MRINTIYLPSLSIALTLSLCANAQAKMPSLYTLYVAAVQADSAYKSTQHKIQADLDQSKILYSGILPTVGVNIASTSTNTHVDGLPNQNYHGTNSQLQLKQPLYNASAWADYRSSKLGDPMFVLAEKIAQQNLIVKVSNAYFDVLKTIDQLDAIKAQKKSALLQLALAKKSFEVGTATITDSRTAQAAADQAAAAEIMANNTLAIKTLVLEQITGQKIDVIDTEVDPKTMPLLMPENVNEWVSMARSNNPNLTQAQLALHQADLAVDKAEAGHKPTVDLTAAYANSTGTSPSNQFGTKANQTVVGVSVTIPLFAGFAVQNMVKQAVDLRDKAQSDLDNARQNVEQGVRTAFSSVSSGLASVTALEAAKESGKSALEASELSYKVGVGTNNDVLVQQSNFYQVITNLSNARFGVLQADIQLLQIAGTLAPENLHAIDKNLGF